MKKGNWCSQKLKKINMITEELLKYRTIWEKVDGEY